MHESHINKFYLKAIQQTLIKRHSKGPSLKRGIRLLFETIEDKGDCRAIAPLVGTYVERGPGP